MGAHTVGQCINDNSNYHGPWLPGKDTYSFDNTYYTIMFDTASQYLQTVCLFVCLFVCFCLFVCLFCLFVCLKIMTRECPIRDKTPCKYHILLLDLPMTNQTSVHAMQCTGSCPHDRDIWYNTLFFNISLESGNSGIIYSCSFFSLHVQTKCFPNMTALQLMTPILNVE
jgi:hypothetical protein